MSAPKTEKKKPVKKKSTTKAVAKREPKQITKRGDLRGLRNVNPQQLIIKAIERNVPIEILERLLLMSDKFKKDEAEIAFREAMSGFQAECPVIPKRKIVRNRDGTIRYRYAPIEDIIPLVQPLIDKYGFSYDIEMEQKELTISGTTTVFHVLGHSKRSSFGIPIAVPPEMKMSEQHKWAGGQTYVKRISFCNAFGILTGDEDTNGNGGGNGEDPTDADLDEKKAKLENDLPPDVLDGYRLLGYGVKAAHAFSQKFEWNAEKIKIEINRILDAKNATL